MKYQRTLTGLIAAIVGCVLVFVPASQAHAWFFGSHGSGGGSCGSHGSHGSWGSHGSGGSHGSWGSHGSSGGGSWGPTKGNASQNSYYRGTPTTNTATREARLTVELPAMAKVTVNGRATKSEGATRRFVLRNLQNGRKYRYEIRAEMEQKGKVVEQTKVVQLRVGDNYRVVMDFDSNEPIASQSVQTKLTLIVPENAKVKLADNDMSLIGSTRTYITSQIASGEKWSDYRIQVTLQREGQTLMQEKSITLKGGELHSLAFNFDKPQSVDTNELASR